MYAAITPLKFNMEPKNQPIEKEKSSKPPFLRSMIIFQKVCRVCLIA